MAYANFISDLLSVVFAKYKELIRLFEMECVKRNISSKSTVSAAVV